MNRSVRAASLCAWACAAWLGLFVTEANADLFYLTEDRLIEGILVREDTATVTFKLEGAGLWTLSRHSLHKMERESPGAYWLRVGARQVDQDKLDKARDSFKKAQQEPQTKEEAESKLRELDVLEGISIPTETAEDKPPVPAVVAETTKPSVEEKTPLSEIVEENQPAMAPPAEEVKPGADRKVEVASVGPSVPPPVRKEAPPTEVEKPGPNRKVEVASVGPSVPRPALKKDRSSVSKMRSKPRSGMEEQLSEVIRTHSHQNGVDPLLVKAVISVESGWNPRARSSSGAQGLMQLMPETAAHLGVSDPFDPVDNIRGGVKYLGEMMSEFADLAWPDRVTQALASYNAGLGTIREVGDYRKIPKTRRYIEKVMKAYHEIRNRKDSEFAYLGPDPLF